MMTWGCPLKEGQRKLEVSPILSRQVEGFSEGRIELGEGISVDEVRKSQLFQTEEEVGTRRN